MDLKLQKSKIGNQQSTINVTGSKSESNRLLLLQALYPHIEIKNCSNSDDSVVMSEALSSSSNIIDIHHAGTAMRFLTAYFATQDGREVVLTGSDRMKERPIKILVDALKSLGADISYLETEGFPPLKIKGRQLSNNKVALKAHVSSQYISALLLIAAKLENGLELTLEGEITSIPYINMTLSLLNEVGIKTSFKGQLIKVYQQAAISKQELIIESDWSSASYFYSMIALSELGTEVKLSAYKQNSLQGDSVLSEIYQQFGVETHFHNTRITLRKSKNVDLESIITLNLSNSPDIAQTIAVTCLGLGLECKLTGLHTLKIKETDRLLALKTEIEKLGGEVAITSNSLHLKALKVKINTVAIDTYNDHRMALSFAPLALVTSITIRDAEVVSKSFPSFWNDLKALGFQVEKI
ncbi:3-phosphoshikimate 1-carboxyvinyltransferase [Xanthomarina sp. F1114]|uniref:3-phosphoshikimate 1-carboxyvinyltransferase n=1 Tax=Xanthomarina sp. F1114 TaxID=2996019 RepID=UPI00225DFB96|nr:3-phosphoshikimate 1-carboxyvinyltransferase [Xanthomarina sp. F1114]MCX7546668.1 3-phosphoshikimate 1-carboxyvinyltransferase [Xanthomarina sp. F1114]